MKITKCNVCGNEHITQEENIYQCKECGFHTTDMYVKLSKNYIKSPKTQFDQYLVHMPKIVQDLKKYDRASKTYWLPMILNVYPVGIIYPNGLDKENWSWMFSEYKAIPINERINFPNPQKPGEYFEYQLDIDNEKMLDTYKDGLDLLQQ